jgi:hypothetical protein
MPLGPPAEPLRGTANFSKRRHQYLAVSDHTERKREVKVTLCRGARSRKRAP